MTNLEKARLIALSGNGEGIDRLCRLVQAGIILPAEAKNILFARPKPRAE